MAKSDDILKKENIQLSWKTKIYTDYERNWKWYLALAVSFLAVVSYSIYARDWFMIVISFILTGILLWYVKQKPEEKEYKISQLGLYEGERLYPYNEIHSFWILIKPDVRQLNIIFNKKYLPQLSILLPENVDPYTIKTLLGSYIPEQDNRDESLIDLLSRKFKI